MSTVQADSSTPIILAENLSKVYAAGRIMVAAVRDVSFQVTRGEFVAIVGPSGSGKLSLDILLRWFEGWRNASHIQPCGLRRRDCHRARADAPAGSLNQPGIPP